MNIDGAQSVAYLKSQSHRVALHKKDNTDKLWSYKLKSGRKSEFSFDPKTKTGLFLWVSREPPSIAGITNIESVVGKDVSTALGRAFSGGVHNARFKANIESLDALDRLIRHFEGL